MRRISSKSGVIRYHQSSQTRCSSRAWPARCTRHSSLQWCRRPIPLPVASGFHPSQVNQRTVGPDQRHQNQWSPPRAPQIPAKGSRSRSPSLPTLIQIRPMSLPQRGNRLLGVSKSSSPICSGSEGVRLLQAAPKMVPLPPRYRRSWKPMMLRPQPPVNHPRPLSRQLGLSCMARTFLKSRKSVPKSLAFLKERRPLRRLLTPHLHSN